MSVSPVTAAAPRGRPAPDLGSILRQAFPGVSEADIAALSSAAVVQTYPGEHVLCREGQVEHVFYIVADGQVEISQQLGTGEKRVLTRRSAGEFFGEMALIEKKPRTATAMTLGPGTLLEISENEFQSLLAASPRLAMAMIQQFVANVRASGQATIADLTEKNAALRKAYDELAAAQEALVQREKLEHELEIAGEVQRSLLPASFPAAAGFGFAGHNVPARHVGGDLYDVIAVDDEHLGLLMADVSDKSVHAALIMAVTRTLFLAHARRSLVPGDVALAVHHGLLEVSTTDDMFVTVFYGVLHVPTRRLRYVRAGQDRPLLFRAGGGPPLELDADGRFLGMWPSLELEERSVELAPGDLLVAYSDGVVDAMNGDNVFYGRDRLVSLLGGIRQAPAQQVCSAIFDDVFAFRGAAPASDDITVLVTRCEA